MRRYVFCAALNYKELASDLFLNCCKTRERQVVREAPRGEDVQVDIYEFKSGSVHTRKITWANGKPIEAISSSQLFSPITRDDFETRQLKNSQVDNHAFKANRPSVMSIRDIYAGLVKIGKNSPNTLEEFSIFSHSYEEGPILVNSYDDRAVWIPENLRLSPSIGSYRSLQGTERNPDDKDCRSQYDFVSPTLHPVERESIHAAFSKTGKVWVWGCAFDYGTNSLMSAVLRVIGGKTDLSDSAVLKFKNLTIEQLNAFTDFADALKINRDRLSKSRACEAKFGDIRRALWDRATSCYTFQAAQGLGVPCIGAIYGTYASFDPGSSGLLSVSADTVRNVLFYRTYFGVKTDPEGRNYVVFTPGMKIKRLDDGT